MKQFRASPTLWPVLLFALIFLAAGSARANCSNPASVERDIIYNGDYHTFQFCNGTTWIQFGGSSSGSGGGLTLISTQTASASASLQFTSLPTTYNTLFLNCNGLVKSAGGTMYVYVGEGAGPTWETGAHYSQAASWDCSDGSLGTTGTNTATNVLNDSSSLLSTLSLKLYIDAVGSSTLHKYSTQQWLKEISGVGCWIGGSSYWNNDTNPITAIEILPTGGSTISSGTCSLYGMN